MRLIVTEGTHLSALEPSSTYSARVRVAGDSLWYDPFVFVTKSGRYHKSGAAANVKNGYFFSLENWTASWVSYEVAPDQAVEIEVSKLDGTSMRSALVKPANRCEGRHCPRHTTGSSIVAAPMLYRRTSRPAALQVSASPQANSRAYPLAQRHRLPCRR